MPSQHAPRALWSSLLLIALIAVGLRLYAINERSVWHDEGLSLAFAQTPLDRFFAVLAYDVHPPLYYCALKAWRQVLPSIPWARALSVLCSLAALALAWPMLKRLLESRAALLALLLLSLSPLSIHYAQELRMYALQAVWAAAMMLTAVECLQRPSLARLSLIILFGVLGCYTHYFAGVFVVGFLCILPWVRMEGERSFGRAWVRTAYAALLSCLLYLPWLRIGFSHLLMNSQGGLYESFSGPMTFADLRAQAVEALLGLVPSFPLDRWIFPPERLGLARLGLSNAFAAGMVALSIAGGYALWKTPWKRLFLVAFLILPLLLAIAFQLLGGRFYARFYLPILPLFFASVAAGILALPRRWERWLVAVILVSILASSSVSLIRYDIRDVSRDAAQYLAEHAHPDATILHASPHSFWNLQAYDNSFDHRMLAGPQVPALIRKVYGPTAIVTPRDVNKLQDVWVIYGEWRPGPPQLRSRLEPLWFAEWHVADPPVLIARFIKQMEIVHYKKSPAQ